MPVVFASTPAAITPMTTTTIPAVGRVAAKMFHGVVLCTHNRTDFFAGIAGIEIVEQIAKRGKIVVAFVAVHTAVDGDIQYIALSEETLGVVANF